jgi:tricarballylate dehydrogenase
MESLTCDVAVVGSGVAGLSAALSAAESGADVVIVERAQRGEHGGNTRYTEAFLRMRSVGEAAEDFEDSLAANSGGLIDLALAAGILDGEEDSWHPLVRTLNFTNPILISRFAEEAGPTLEWLEEFGLRFEPLASPFITVSTTRLAPVGGGLAIVEALTAAADERGIGWEFETTAQELSVDDDGVVRGLRARRAGGARVEVNAGSVILASGGFQGNEEMMSRYVERAALVRPIAVGGHYDRGEGIAMALAAGAAPAGNYGLFHAEPIDPRAGIAEPALFIFPYGILVNAAGERFVDEAPGTVDATYEAITRRILEQSGGSAYVVLDEKLEEVPNHAVAIRTDQPPITADSLEGLAEALGLPVDAFLATVERYNRSCPDPAAFDPLATDGLATDGLQPPKSNWARTIDSAPFRAYPIACANVFSFGGLMVTSDGQVVDSDGSPIAGLYAAGETIGMYHGTYVGSTSVLRGAVFGRLSGRQATHSTAAGAR